MSVIEIAKIAVSIYENYLEQERKRNNADERRKLVLLIISKIEQSKNEIIQELYRIDLQDSRGNLEAAINDYITYSSNIGDDRLINDVRSKANGVSSDLGSKIDDVFRDKPDIAISAFPAYVQSVGLYLSSLLEWHLIKPNEHVIVKIVAHVLKLLKERVARVKSALRKASDARFSSLSFGKCIEQCVFDERQWSYKFEGRKSYIHTFISPQAEAEKEAEKQFGRRKDGEFLKYLYVESIVELEKKLEM